MMYNKLEDYLTDDTFIKYVLDGEANKWQELSLGNIQYRDIYDEAIQILLASESVEVCLNNSECNELKNRIFDSLALEN